MFAFIDISLFPLTVCANSPFFPCFFVVFFCFVLVNAQRLQSDFHNGKSKLCLARKQGIGKSFISHSSDFIQACCSVMSVFGLSLQGQAACLSFLSSSRSLLRTSICKPPAKGEWFHSHLSQGTQRLQISAPVLADKASVLAHPVFPKSQRDYARNLGLCYCLNMMFMIFVVPVFGLVATNRGVCHFKC